MITIAICACIMFSVACICFGPLMQLAKYANMDYSTDPIAQRINEITTSEINEEDQIKLCMIALYHVAAAKETESYIQRILKENGIDYKE